MLRVNDNVIQRYKDTPLPPRFRLSVCTSTVLNISFVHSMKFTVYSLTLYDSPSNNIYLVGIDFVGMILLPRVVLVFYLSFSLSHPHSVSIYLLSLFSLSFFIAKTRGPHSFLAVSIAISCTAVQKSLELRGKLIYKHTRFESSSLFHAEGTTGL